LLEDCCAAFLSFAWNPFQFYFKGFLISCPVPLQAFISKIMLWGKSRIVSLLLCIRVMEPLSILSAISLADLFSSLLKRTVSIHMFIASQVQLLKWIIKVFFKEGIF